MYESIYDSQFSAELQNIEKRGIIAGCSAGAMIMGEKMIKGVGLNYIPKTIVIPHYGESFYSWISNTVKILNRGKYKLLCLEKNTYFVKDGDQLTVLGKQNIHIIFKKDQQDTRVKHIFLNEKGKKIFKEIFEVQKKRIYNALLNSSSEEVINFDNVLKKIINE